MFRRFVVLSSAAALALLLTAPARAADPPANKDRQAAKAEPAQAEVIFDGTIAKIDANKRVLTLEGARRSDAQKTNAAKTGDEGTATKGGTQTFFLTGNARVDLGSQTSVLQDLKPGMHAKVYVYAVDLKGKTASGASAGKGGNMTKAHRVDATAKGAANEPNAQGGRNR